jgi:hypothetical protein
MIKKNNNNVTINVRDLTYKHSIKKFCMRNKLTNQWKDYQTLVVNLPNDRKHHKNAKDDPPQELCLTSKRKNLKTKTKNDPLTREWVLLCKNERQRPLFISS